MKVKASTDMADASKAQSLYRTVYIQRRPPEPYGTSKSPDFLGDKTMNERCQPDGRLHFQIGAEHQPIQQDVRHPAIYMLYHLLLLSPWPVIEPSN